MSVVACRVTSEKIEIASDSISVRGWTQSRNANRLSKLKQVNGMIVGGVGSAEEVSLFFLFCSTHKPERADESGLLFFMSEFSSWKKGRTESGKINNSYIIVIEGKAFHVDEYMIDEILQYEAIGAGMDFALAAMYLGNSAERAVDVACELSILCEPPIVSYTADRIL